MPSQTKQVPERLWLRRWLIGLSVVAVTVVLYAVVVRFVLPDVLRTAIERRATEALGRATTVEAIEIDPFRLALHLSGVRVADAAGAPPLLTVERVDADFSSASLWKRAPVVESLAIVRPSVALARLGPNRYSVQDLVERAQASPPGPPPPFSLNNIEVVDGRLAFEDRPAGRTHRIESLAVGIPFLSTLAYETTITVQPKLAATVNGTRVALAGTTTPFAQTREASLDIDLDALPLPAYVGYLPQRPRVDLASGSLTSRLRLTFAQPEGAAATVGLSGTLRVDGVAILRRDRAPLLRAKSIAVGLDRLDPGARTVAVSRVAVAAPEVAIRRAADGSFELGQPWFDAAGAAAPASGPWRIDVKEVTASDGKASIEDASTVPAYRASATNATLRIRDLSTARDAKATLEGAFALDDGAEATVTAEVGVDPVAARGRFEVKGASLVRLYPYAATALAAVIQRGKADVALGFDLATEPAFALRFADGRAALSDLALAAQGEREPAWRMPDVVVEGLEVDANRRLVTLGSVVAKRPFALLRREQDGGWNTTRLMRTTAATGTALPGPSSAAAGAAAADDTWQLVATRLAIEKATLALEDRAGPAPVAVRLGNLDLRAENLGNVRNLRSRVDLRAQVEGGGRLALAGTVGTNPPSAALTVDAVALPLLPLKPYVEAASTLVLAAGTASAKGRLDVGPGPEGDLVARWKGDVAIERFAALDAAAGDDLLQWRALRVTGLSLGSRPLAASAGAIALEDFYARVIVLPDGTLNLQHLAVVDPATVAPPGEASAPSPAPVRAAERAARSRTAGKSVATVAASAESTMRAITKDPLPYAIGRVELARGRVEFTDHFIRPNYDANLTQVAGTISAMSATEAGEIDITARVDDAAPVSLRGRLQPFAAAFALDLKGEARDIELPPLSPYSAKYAGYGITRGKLSFDVAYKVENRKLDASNRLVLDQLTFGERVESPDATRLPVLLAVALLKDRQGRIDIQLPISGTLDDPHFSIGGLIVRVIVNLLTKAVTAPFSLLSAAFGGGEELSYLDCRPGTPVLADDGAAKLDKLARALADRPALKVDVTGNVDPAADRAGLEQAALDRALRAAKFRALSGTPDAPATAEATTIGTEERSRWLAAAYREAPIKERPRNAIGLLKEVPPDEMEAMLVAHAAVGDEALNDLAHRRAQAAKDALVQRGIAAERVFLVAPRDGPHGAPAASRVEFTLR